MSTPASAREASRIAVRILKRSEKGSPSAVTKECHRAAHIADEIWHRWRVGPGQWRQKHVRWVLEHRTDRLSHWTRYRYWLTVVRMLGQLGKLDHWSTALNGPWSRPSTNERKH